MHAYLVASTQWSLPSGMLFSTSPSAVVSYSIARTSAARRGHRTGSMTHVTDCRKR